MRARREKPRRASATSHMGHSRPGRAYSKSGDVRHRPNGPLRYHAIMRRVRDLRRAKPMPLVPPRGQPISWFSFLSRALHVR